VPTRFVVNREVINAGYLPERTQLLAAIARYGPVPAPPRA